MTPPEQYVSVRYIVTTPGRNRIHLVLDDFDAEVARLRDPGLSFRSEVVAGPGGRQVLLADPAENLVERFQPRGSRQVGTEAEVTNGEAAP